MNSTEGLLRSQHASLVHFFSQDSRLGLKSWNWISFSAAHDDTDPLNSEPFLSIEAAGPVYSVLIEFSYFLWAFFCVYTAIL